MANPESLLELAQDIADLHPGESHQPSLRRALSTAYYALFHLLIDEATSNWRQPELRAILGRVFDHGPMKQAADKKVAELNVYFQKAPSEGTERTLAYHLYLVAETFAQAQYHRNEADYNMARTWDRTEVLLHINGLAEAFKSWELVREEPSAQAFLVSMLTTKERRPSEKTPPKRRPSLTDGPKSP